MDRSIATWLGLAGSYAVVPLAFIGLWLLDLWAKSYDLPDEQRFVSLFEPGEYDRFMQAPGALERRADIYVIVGGGNAGIRMAYVVPYGVSSDPVTKPVRTAAAGAPDR